MSQYTGKSLDLSSYSDVRGFYGNNNVLIFGNGKTIVRGSLTSGDISTFSEVQVKDFTSFLSGSSTKAYNGFYNNDGSLFYLITEGSFSSSTYEIIQISGGSSYSIGNTEDAAYAYGGDTGSRIYTSGYFNSDGTAIMVLAFNRLRTYPLSTPYDLSTIGSQSVLYVPDIPNTPVINASYFAIDSVNHTKLYLLDISVRIAYEHQIDSDFNLSSINYDASTATDIDTSDVGSSSASIVYQQENDALYVYDITENVVRQFSSLPDPITPPAGTISEKASGDNYVTLTWMNSLGGWEYWTFTSRHSYGDDVQDLGIIERDIFQDWDSGFINGQSEREVLGKDVTPFTVLRSQALTKEQVDVIKNIRSAIKVQVVTDSGFTTVIVDAGSFTYRTDREKNILIEFTIRYPRTQIQKL
jgi:hypothetical protein